ncbi:MAG TPA: aryl-sulfate sulfotransferase [Phycisphaerae bacterium]|nr:aryl-sulfate sulfotransferase [Phycisphaerae bacterium]
MRTGTPAFRVVALIGSLLAGPAGAYESLQGPTELLHWDREKAFEGYTLFAAHGQTFLIDMAGRVVHTWPVGTNPRFLANGHLLDASRDDPSGYQGFVEMDWDGKVVWQYTEKRPGHMPHHDWVRIDNPKLKAPTTLYIANRSVSQEQALAAGADPQSGPYRNVSVDAVVEVDMQGKVVWEWWFLDHTVQTIAPDKTHYAGAGKTAADWPGRLDLNAPGRPLKRDWLHCNSLDYDPRTGHVVINSVQGECYVIDHDGTFVAGDVAGSLALAAGPKGDFLYRFGDPARHGQGEPPQIRENWNTATSGHKQMGGSHDVQWIRPPLPGAGRLLVFNNGQYLFDRTSQSSVLEIDPRRDASGRTRDGYVHPPDAGYERVEFHHDTHKPPRLVSRQVVWSYQSRSNQGFFSHIGSGAQRLPNGNTLVCAMTEGHLFEVTRDGEVVWEYINPVTREGAVRTLRDSLPGTNAVFRAYRYAAGHPALKGRSLEPLGTITEMVEAGKLALKRKRPEGAGNRPAVAPGDDRPSRGGARGDRSDARGGGRDRPAPSPRTGDGAGARMGPGRGGPRHPVVEALDADGDGEISAEEMRLGPQRLSKLDADGDGQITPDEMRRSTDRQPPRGGEDRDRR